MFGNIHNYVITIDYLIYTKKKVILVTKFLFELVLEGLCFLTPDLFDKIEEGIRRRYNYSLSYCRLDSLETGS